MFNLNYYKFIFAKMMLGLTLVILFLSYPTVLAQTGDGQPYLIQPGDSLWNLAQTFLGDGARFAEIVAATNAKHAQDPTFAQLQEPIQLTPGMKVWIPAAGAPPIQPAPVGAAADPTGHIAFSFWNNAPNRCTYEINVIDVSACRQGLGACQANRRIFKPNNVSEPALSSDGTRLAFRGWGEPSDEDSPYIDCAQPLPVRYLANTTLDGTDLRGTGGFWEDSHPDWSPDGMRLLFDTGRVGDDITRIMLINPDGSGEEELRIAGQQPSWAPDNDRFVYRGCDLTGNRCGLWLARAIPAKPWETGQNMLGPVIQEAAAAHPDWSPVGEQIVYQSPANGSWDLYLVNADGSGQRRLTDDPGIEGLPTWSPDGQWVAYLSDTGGNWGIWVIRPDGSQRRQLFAYDGGIYNISTAVEPYFTRDWLDEQISWSR
jgi:hypothetical protein